MYAVRSLVLFLLMSMSLSMSFLVSKKRNVRPRKLITRMCGSTSGPVTRRQQSSLGSLKDPNYAYHSLNNEYQRKHDMSITFLGTASCSPSPSRGTSCLSLSYGSDKWLFDCGESTQLQIQKAVDVKISKVKKIFITHMHGDHVFGLGGVLCQMGTSHRAAAENEPMGVIDIYGPEGIRDYVRAVTQSTYSKVVPPHRVHELVGVKDMYGNPARRLGEGIPYNRMCNELRGSRDIYPESDGRYTLIDNESDLQVIAAPLSHSIPCVGYVITEKEKPGGIKVDALSQVFDRNIDGLRKLYDNKPGIVFRYLKNLSVGEKYAFPDGTVITSDQCKYRPIKGRKIVVMGDTRSGEGIQPFAQNADVLVHEATNAWVDSDEGSTPEEVQRATYLKGHSTPEMAGNFARSINARQLLLTHFSNRYKGDNSPESIKTMQKIEDLAGFDRESNRVIAAFDFMRLDIPPHKEKS